MNDPVQVELPIGTTLAEWKAEILRLYPTARFQHEHMLQKYHASVGLFRKGTWYGYGHDANGVLSPNPHTAAWVKKEKV